MNKLRIILAALSAVAAAALLVPTTRAQISAGIATVKIDQTTPGTTDSVSLAVGQGAGATIGAKTDAKSTATDGTSVSIMQVLKEISAMAQAPAAIPAGSSLIGHTGWKRTYTASSAITCTLASLATSSTLVAGEECAAIDNSSNLDGDILLSGKFTTGTSPAAGVIEIWVIPELDDSTWPDVFDGTDSTETATTRDILVGSGALAWAVVTDTTNNRTYYMKKTSVAALFGGTLPRKMVVFATHNTTVNLNSTGSNHAVYVEPVK